MFVRRRAKHVSSSRGTKTHLTQLGGQGKAKLGKARGDKGVDQNTISKGKWDKALSKELIKAV